jgi:hypothetical protein
MATVNKILGTAVNVGFAGTAGGITITNPAVSATLQECGYSTDGSNERVLDEVGNRMSSIWTDPHAKADLKLVIKGAGLADVIAQTAIIEAITPGMLLTVGACQQAPGMVAANWEVMNAPKITGTNKNAKEWTLSLEKAPGITATAAP